MSYLEKLALSLTVAAQARGVKPTGQTWIPRGVNLPTPAVWASDDVTRRFELTPEKQREACRDGICPTRYLPHYAREEAARKLFIANDFKAARREDEFAASLRVAYFGPGF